MNSYKTKFINGIQGIIFNSIAGSNYIYSTVTKAGCQSCAYIIGEEICGLKETENPNQTVRGKVKTITRESLCLNEKDYENYFKFSFVRHPKDRLKSIYFGLRGKEPSWSVLCSAIGITGERNVNSFEGFLERILNIENINSVDIHLLQQTAVLYESKLILPNHNIKPSYDFIGKVENWNNDWKTVCKETGKDFNYNIRLNTTPTERKRKFSKIEEDLLSEVVDKHYKIDLDNFGYDN